MITIKDIAREAGVSAMTVSRVINKRYHEVSDETIQKVERIIQKYNYIPNSAARSLSSRSARIIALFIKGNYDALQSAYNSMMLGYLISDIQAKGYDTMVHFITRYEDVLDKLQSWSASGALFFGVPENDIDKISENTNIPLIFMDCYTKNRKITNIGIDDEQGGILAARYLIRHGHTNLAFSGENIYGSPVIVSRLTGFQKALQKAGMELTPDHILAYSDGDRIKEALARIRGQHLAVFCHSDLHAVRVMQYIREMGYRIPEDFSIIGFDNIHFCDAVYPKLTSIAQDIRKKADTASNVLMKHLIHPDLPVQNIILPVSLIERESVRFLDKS